MAIQLVPSWFLLISFASAALLIISTSSTATAAAAAAAAAPAMQPQVEKTYVVYMGERPQGELDASSMYTNMLTEVKGSAVSAAESLVYSYHRSFLGFAAKLTEEEMKKLAGMDGIVSVFPNGKKQLFTTRSWDFMGFPLDVKRAPLEKDVIIGMLDTGIWPESESFNDKGLGAPPSKWKGTCQANFNFTCNNKIIGAKSYEAATSPRDTEGHGTHTASTAAGVIVANASLYGLASGTARGGVPSARLAVYKVCGSFGCSDADILAGFDDAIADGVDIISFSIGSNFPSEYFQDSIAIGGFHAMKNGILTSAAAGNSGPGALTVANFAPWFLTVAASTIDRKFVAGVKLGNNNVYKGLAINTFVLNKTSYPLVYGGDVALNGSPDGFLSSFCLAGTMNNTLINGKIVLCDEEDVSGLVGTGAIGGIMRLNGRVDTAFTFPLPGSFLGLDEGNAVFSYINKTRKPTATIEKSVDAKDILAPRVASFSSRGPNPITSDILKPDLTAPGVDIIAAWSQGTTLTGGAGDTRVVPYNIISGTSMATPHASGAAAYVKSFRPTWSPAAIKSALMTTATKMGAGFNNDTEFDFGAGHIDPIRATQPGLIYDLREIDYVFFLCGQGYSSQQLQLITGDKSTTCTAANNHTTVWDLNYPSFALSMAPGNESVTRVFHRTVTNVGLPVSTYTARYAVTMPVRGIRIKVEPSVLKFKSLGQRQSFKVTISGQLSQNDLVSASLVWDDGVHKVRSPIVVYSQFL